MGPYPPVEKRKSWQVAANEKYCKAIQVLGSLVTSVDVGRACTGTKLVRQLHSGIRLKSPWQWLSRS